jgi:hypothetical protein
MSHLQAGFITVAVVVIAVCVLVWLMIGLRR